jgi:hypothetical protein
MRIKRNIHWVALFVGVLAAFVEGLSNVDDIAHKVGTLYDPGVFAAAVTSIGAAVLLAFTIKSFQQKHFFVGFGLALTLVFTAAYTMSTTLNRTSDARQKSLAKVYEADGQWQQLFKAYKATSDRQAWECGQGAGVKCNNNTAAAILALDQVRKRQSELDAMGQQVQWMLSLVGINTSVETAGRIQPLFLPLALFLLGMMCIAFGENGEWVEPEFDTKLVGREAIEDKVKRFIEAYKTANNGATPPVSQVQKVANIKEWQARTLVKKYA